MDKLEELSRKRLEGFREKQVMEWTETAWNHFPPETALDARLRKGIDFPAEYVIQSKAWLTLENYHFYVGQAVRILEDWNTPPRRLSTRNAKALHDLRKELEALDQAKEGHPPEKASDSNAVADVDSHMPHTLLVWKACQDKDRELGRKAKAGEVWKLLQTNLRTYDPNKEIIESMDANTMKYCRADSGDSPSSLPRTAFSSKLSRLRKNPPM